MKTVALKPTVINLEKIIEENAEVDAFVVNGPSNSVVAIKKAILIKLQEADQMTINEAPGSFMFGSKINLDWGFPGLGIDSTNKFYVYLGVKMDGLFYFRISCDSPFAIAKQIREFIDSCKYSCKNNELKSDWNITTF